MKGMASLIASGTVADSPLAIAAFIRENKSTLDPTQIGEYFGHHEDQAVGHLTQSCESECHSLLSICTQLLSPQETACIQQTAFRLDLHAHERV